MLRALKLSEMLPSHKNMGFLEPQMSRMKGFQKLCACESDEVAGLIGSLFLLALLPVARYGQCAGVSKFIFYSASWTSK